MLDFNLHKRIKLLILLIPRRWKMINDLRAMNGMLYDMGSSIVQSVEARNYLHDMGPQQNT